MTSRTPRTSPTTGALRQPFRSRCYFQAFKALLMIGWIVLGLCLLVAGALNLHMFSILTGAGLLSAGQIFRLWIVAAWR
ncbi:hypothetical protein D3C72_594830 [compost metagenome]